MSKYPKRNLRKSSTLSMVAGRSEKFSSDITQDTDVKDLPDSQKVKLCFLKDEQLVDDPDNVTTYGSEYQIDNLAEVMKEYGFQGVILAYPIGDGKYRIESGHRRRLAGRKAGIKDFPVLETIPPKTEYERKRRLFGANLLSRDTTPMITARVADNLYFTFKDEYEYKKANDLLEKDENGNVIESGDIMKKVGVFMGMEVRTINKYRTLLKLNPQLQDMADSKEYSWTALVDAATLSSEKQDELASDIRNESEPVTKAWIVKRCRDLKEEEISASLIEESVSDTDLTGTAFFNDTPELESKEEAKGEIKGEITKEEEELNTDTENAIIKPVDVPPVEPIKKPRSAGYIKPKVATKKIMKFSSDLVEVLKDDYVIPDEDLEQVQAELESLKKSIQSKLEYIENRKS